MHKLAKLSASYFYLEKILQDNDFLKDKIYNCLRHYIVYEKDKNTHLKYLKTHEQILVPLTIFCKNIQDVPKSIWFPSIIKSETNFNLGPQTQLVENYQDLKKYFKYFFNVSKSSKYIWSGYIQEPIPAGKDFTIVTLVGKHNHIILGSAVDKKKFYEGDLGMNTSSMGAYTEEIIPKSIIEATDIIVNYVKEKYKFIGFMSWQYRKDNNNNWWFLEINLRLCCPEFICVAKSFEPETIYKICEQAYTEKHIDNIKPKFKNCIAVMLWNKKFPLPQKEATEIIWKFENNDRNEIEVMHDYSTHNLTPACVVSSGQLSKNQLADKLYQFVNKQNLTNYHYRKDIHL